MATYNDTFTYGEAGVAYDGSGAPSGGGGGSSSGNSCDCCQPGSSSSVAPVAVVCGGETHLFPRELPVTVTAVSCPPLSPVPYTAGDVIIFEYQGQFTDNGPHGNSQVGGTLLRHRWTAKHTDCSGICDADTDLFYLDVYEFSGNLITEFMWDRAPSSWCADGNTAKFCGDHGPISVQVNYAENEDNCCDAAGQTAGDITLLVEEV